MHFRLLLLAGPFQTVDHAVQTGGLCSPASEQDKGPASPRVESGLCCRIIVVFFLVSALWWERLV